MDDASRDELIVRIDERVLAIQDALTVGDRRFDNHSKRLGALEKWRAGLAAAISVVFGLLAMIAGWYETH